MKKILKIAALIITVSQLSFTTDKIVGVNEQKVMEVEKKYHLTRITGVHPVNAKQFVTLDEFEAYLKSRRRVIKAKATASVIKKKSIPPGGGSSANGYQTATEFGGNYSANFEFNQFLIDGYAEMASITWNTFNTTVGSGLGSSNFYPITSGLNSFFYTHHGGSRNNNYMTAYGEYEELYSFGGSTFLLMYKYEIDAGWDGSLGITANATIYPKY